MGFGMRYYAVHGGRIYRLPTGKVNKNLPVLLELAGQLVKQVSVAVRYEDRIPTDIHQVWLEERPVLADGTIDFVTETRATAEMVDTFLFGGAVPAKKQVLLSRKESIALINTLKEDLGDLVVANYPYFFDAGIQAPKIIFRVIQGGVKQACHPEKLSC